MEYRTSKREIIRRQRAYLRLSLSLLLGMFLFSVLFQFSLTFVHYVSVSTILFLIGVFSFRFLQTLAHTKTILNHHTLSRKFGDVTVHYPLQHIARVKIKWTTHHSIREMYIWLDNGQRVFISALEKSEQFKQDLLEKLTEKVLVTETHEPIDFDHPLFYSLLGLPISGFGLWFLKMLTGMTLVQTKLFLVAFMVYLFVFGSYFMIATPLSNRYINKNKSVDFVMGGLMILFAGVLLVVNMGFFSQ